MFIDHIGPSFTAFAWAHLGGDSLLVSWHQVATDNTVSHIATALTTDGGQHWTVMPSLRSADNVDWLDMAIDRFGTPHLVYRSTGVLATLDTPVQIMHTTWHKGVWYPPAVFSTHPGLVDPMIGRGADATLLATWDEIQARPTSPAEYTLRSFGSLWSATCR